MSKVENKPNLRQFEVTRNYCDECGWKEEHIFTSDSFKEAVEKAADEIVICMDEGCVRISVYEADEETLVCRYHEKEIVNLYRLRKYLI